MDFPPRKLLPVVLATCALALGLAACGGDGGAKSSKDVPVDAIALVGEQEVPTAEYDQLIERAEKGYKAQKRPFPKAGSAEFKDLKTRAVQFLVRRYEFREEAETIGVEVTEAEVTKRLDELKKESFEGDEKKFTAELAKLGLTEEQAREEIRDRILQEKIFEKVTGDVQVPDGEIEAYYEANEAQFTEPRQVRHILVKKKERADELLTDIQGGADFARIAREFSDDETSAKQGGKLTVTKGQTVPPFDKIAFSIEEGKISDPVKTQFGYHIIEALAPLEVTPLSEVRSSIEQQLLQQKQSDAMNTWVKQTEKKYANDIVYAVGFEPAKTEPPQQTTQP